MKIFSGRLLCSPKKIKFFLNGMNFIDFLALIPLFLTILLESIKDLAIMGKAGEKNLRIFFCKKQIIFQVGFFIAA